MASECLIASRAESGPSETMLTVPSPEASLIRKAASTAWASKGEMTGEMPCAGNTRMACSSTLKAAAGVSGSGICFTQTMTSIGSSLTDWIGVRKKFSVGRESGRASNWLLCRRSRTQAVSWDTDCLAEQRIHEGVIDSASHIWLALGCVQFGPVMSSDLASPAIGTLVLLSQCAQCAL